MKVSVIMTTHIENHVLKDSIKSVLFQDADFDYELFIIDNNVDDDSFLTLNFFNENYDNIHVLKRGNRESDSDLLDKIIVSCKGEYLAFIDSNDIWERDKLRIQDELIKKTKAVLAFSDFSFYNIEDDFNGRHLSQWTFFNKLLKENKDSQVCKNMFPVLLKENVVQFSTVVIKKSSFIDALNEHFELNYTKFWELLLNVSLSHHFVFSKKNLVSCHYEHDDESIKPDIINIVKQHKSDCNKKTYLISKANCYALIGKSEFIRHHYKKAFHYYGKSFKNHIQFDNIKSLFQGMSNSIKHH